MPPVGVLGATLDVMLGFEEHAGQVIGRTMVRHGVMPQLACTSWSLGAGLPRSTHKALITGVIGYELAMVGSFAYDGLLNRMETQSANVAARRIIGVRWAARLEVLRLTSGALSARN